MSAYDERASYDPRSMTRLSLLVELASTLAREIDLDAWLASAAHALASAMSAERASIWLVDAEEGDLVTRVAVLPEVPALRQRIGAGVVGTVARSAEVLRIDDASRDPRFDPSADRVTGFTTRSILAAPIREDASAPVRGVVQVLNASAGSFDAEDAAYLEVLGRELGRALAMTTLRPDDASGPGLVLRGPFNRIVGRGAAMEAVYERVGLAAQTDATVLLRGETGTGKTLLARAIHVNSPRRDGPFVTVDCTTLPPQLVESELFGHERGAFTGADRRVRGRVEMASGGTLFLDEIGDLPPEIQGKLLRFVQDRVFERVGGRETLRADVRLLCATHHDLERAVDEGRFRRDLYYRIRVLEIEVPRLASRGPDEIERLARHFADLYAKRHGRPEPRFEEDAIDVLRAHAWPGNVRELEHWIESALVLAPDGVIRRSRFPAQRGGAEPKREARDAVVLAPNQKLDDAMREYVRATVQALGGNRSEAARRLGVSRNTIARAMRG
ncbi:Response regulator of zinc sigma-54-dependent two-component system [Sandaracinus amylolyticus]|uniref:Response regulator of zinc sigma-54-dependent two-component system n=2 Tax=Sandaracinus amylolyticus TaxID=927083 RepID=A0A0F6W4S0_9BACT|nr:Response regulator of zinc sigma-54-dependent two-component system [Sandaracinus amylolyticus]